MTAVTKTGIFFQERGSGRADRRQAAAGTSSCGAGSAPPKLTWPREGTLAFLDVHPAEEFEPDQAERAIRAARAIVQVLADDNRRRRAGGEIALRLRIGINTGPAVVGNIGSASRVNYTLVGDTVNVAERLEGLAKAHHGDEDVIVLVSESTADEIGTDDELTSLGEHELRGLEGQVRVFRLNPAP